MDLSHQQIENFREEVAQYYAHHARHELPWRIADIDGGFDPYRIMVSELMLQQTQVARVIPKYLAFLEQFPTVQSLARVELGDVLRMWQGLGYNRRAKFLWQAAQNVDAQGSFPDSLEGLVQLPGIGVNTAGAILAYAYDQPAIFIETNVRTVYIHHFLPGDSLVDDKVVRALLEQTLDQENPREFYWSLMDYGSHLKATVGNLNRASKHYVKQSKFDGSLRQIRGQVIRSLGETNKTLTQLQMEIIDKRLELVLEELLSEKLIRQNGSAYSL